MSSKINDLSNSALRKRFFEVDFVPDNNLAIGSIRVSSKKQERGQSILEQKEINEKYGCREKLAYVKTWQVAESAANHELRKHFHEMIQFIKASQKTSTPVKHLVFSHQSRSNRNKQSARELEELVEMGVTLHFARDGRKLTCKSDVAELIMWHIENIKNQSMIDELTKNSMGGTIKCIERGCYPGSKPPFGYKSAGRKDRRHFLLDGDSAKYMSTAFEIIDTTYATERLSDQALKNKLDGMFPGLKTPHRKRFCELLRDPFYTGEEFIYFKTIYKADTSIQPTVVLRDRWLRVQMILNGRRRARKESVEVPYVGMLTCRGTILDESGVKTKEVCDCAVTGEQKTKTYKNGNIQIFTYYRCSNQSRQCSQREKIHMKTVGRKMNYNDYEIELMFQEIFKAFTFDEVTVQRMKSYLWAEHFTAKKTHNQRRTELEHRMRELDSFIQQAYQDKLKGLITESYWREQDSQWKLEQGNITAELDNLFDSQDEYMQRGVQLIELMQHSETIFKNATPEKKRKMVELVSSNLSLKDGKLSYDWRKPFDMLAVKGDLEEWRARQDSNLRPPH